MHSSLQTTLGGLGARRRVRSLIAGIAFAICGVVLQANATKAQALTTWCYHPASGSCTGWAYIYNGVGYGPNGVGAQYQKMSSAFTWNQNLPSQRNCVQPWSITSGNPLGGWFCATDWRWEASYASLPNLPYPPPTTFVGARCTQTTLAWTNGKCGIRYYP